VSDNQAIDTSKEAVEAMAEKIENPPYRRADETPEQAKQRRMADCIAAADMIRALAAERDNERFVRKALDQALTESIRQTEFAVAKAARSAKEATS
jgi:hypothetical protein